MIERFQGDREAMRRFREAMLAQQCVCHNEDVADAFCSAAELRELKPGETLIQEGDTAIDIFFILAGRVSIRVKNREVALRHYEQHVGEIAMIDRSSTRSATVVALETTVVAKVSEPVFTNVAGKNPNLWRCLANELGRRLRERAKHVTEPNPRPVIFIGSSVEGLPVARAIQAAFAYDDFIVHPWNENVFTASRGTMARLEQTIGGADFGILVCTPDDRIINEAREVDMVAPRDNVILELGMCIGKMGSERAFFVYPRMRDFKIPSDLLGITGLDYADGEPKTLNARLGQVCTKIRDVVNELKVR